MKLLATERSGISHKSLVALHPWQGGSYDNLMGVASCAREDEVCHEGIAEIEQYKRMKDVREVYVI